jgi:uncharacterized protein (TIRG00374 family)
VAVLLLWLLFRGTDWGEVGRALRDLGLGWLLLAQAILVGSCFARVQRWTYVVRATQPASFRGLFSATQIGFLVNFTLPARLGELVRALVLSRLEQVPLARSVALVALDRLNDVIGLLAIFGVVAVALSAEAQVTLPAGALGNQDPLVVSSALIRPASLTLVAIVVLGLGSLVFLYTRQHGVVGAVRAGVGWLSPNLAERVAYAVESFAEGLHVFRSGADLARSVFWSLVTWGANAAALAALLAAFHLDFPWHAPFLLLALIAVLIAVPVTPGVVGQYHVPAVAGLLMAAPETAPASAKAFALVSHLWTLLPIAVLGLWCLYQERLGLGDLVRQSARSEGS